MSVNRSEKNSHCFPYLVLVLAYFISVTVILIVVQLHSKTLNASVIKLTGVGKDSFQIHVRSCELSSITFDLAQFECAWRRWLQSRSCIEVEFLVMFVASQYCLGIAQKTPMNSTWRKIQIQDWKTFKHSSDVMSMCNECHASEFHSYQNQLWSEMGAVYVADNWNAT